MHKKYLRRLANPNIVVAISLIAVMSVFFALYKHSNREYKASIDSAKTDIERLTNVVASNVELSFLSVDQTLQRATERQYFNQLFGGNLNTDMEHNLSLWVNKNPHIDALLLTDENGIVQLLFKKGSSRLQVKPGYKFSVREHFVKHKNNSKIELLITAAKTKGSNKHHRIFASRRLEKINGEFGGLAIAIIDGNYLVDLLNSLGNSDKNRIEIFLDGYELLVNDSEESDQVNMFRTAADDIEKTESGQVGIVDKYLNNEFNLFAFKKLPDLPITVGIMTNENSIFAGWSKNKNSYYAFATICCLFMATVIFFVFLINKQIAVAKNSERKAILANQTKSEFLAKMSHELRTPLNAIIGFSEMLSTGYFGKVSTSQVERLNDINMCGNHLLDLINDILDFSKGDAGKLTLREKVIDINSIAIKSIRILEQKAKIAEVKIINRIPRDINSLYADGRKIKQILINLIANSIKFTPAGGKITVSAKIDIDNNFVLIVEDTGIGIKQTDIPRAMTIFEQINENDEQGGTGLGLPLCKMFTEMHGGIFKLESTEGVGTIVSIILPEDRVRKPIFEEELMAA